jgi:hypothetical protein
MDAQPQQTAALRLDEAPAFMRGFVQNIILRRAVPFTGTAGVQFVSLTPERVEVRLANEHRCRTTSAGRARLGHEPAGRNGHRHGGGHERARRLPAAGQGAEHGVQKARHRALKAVATLTAEQRAAMQASDKGEVQVRSP